jgi:biopolymer transport protein ExbB
MMIEQLNMKQVGILFAAGLLTFSAQAQSLDMTSRLEQSLADLDRVRSGISDEKLPMVKVLNGLEDEVLEVRLEYQQVTRQLDSRNLDLNNLRSEIKTRKDEKNYISNLLSEYTRNFQARLHIAELDWYQDMVDAAALAPENATFSDQQIFDRQTALVSASIERLQEIVGGAAFEGTAVGEDGLVKGGSFLLIGPVALFASEDGLLAGIAEQRLGSLEPTVLPFADAANAAQVRATVAAKEGLFPLDASLGNARKIEETSPTLAETLQKGGFVGYVIVTMFILAVITAISKWVQLSRIPMPSEADVKPLLDAMLHDDHEEAQQALKKVKGPSQQLLAVGLEHIDEPHELVEEVMYEEMLLMRLKVEKFTPFIAVCASSAPLLGLLGTVTGIINTFKMIAVFGSGDVKTLSGGISEALVTTAQGLIVAIFSLILYAFLSRKGKSIMDRMEQIAILFMNRTTRTAPIAVED